MRFLGETDATFALLHAGDEAGALTHAELERRAAHGGPDPNHAPLDPAQIAQLLAARYAARRRGDYARADALRRTLHAQGVALEDTSDGVRWRRS